MSRGTGKDRQHVSLASSCDVSSQIFVFIHMIGKHSECQNVTHGVQTGALTTILCEKGSNLGKFS